MGIRFFVLVCNDHTFLLRPVLENLLGGTLSAPHIKIIGKSSIRSPKNCIFYNIRKHPEKMQKS